jgi:hypothetical protein
MGFFKGANEAEKKDASGNRNYFRDGQYLLQVSETVGDKTWEDDIPYFRVHFDILQTTSTMKEVRPGQNASWMQMLTKKNLKSAHAACRTYGAALFNATFEDCDEETLDLLVGADQPSNGMWIHLKATEGFLKPTIDEKTGEKKTRPFTFHEWSPVLDTEFTVQQIAEIRASVGLPALSPAVWTKAQQLRQLFAKEQAA